MKWTSACCGSTTVPAHSPRRCGARADYYKEKYGREPTLCLVNPDTWDDADSKKLPVEMRQARLVLPNHFWIGVEDDLRRVNRPEKRAARTERVPAPALQSERAA